MNPLVTRPLYLVYMAKVSILKKKGYDRRTYESVENKSHSYVISQKSTENKTQVLMC